MCAEGLFILNFGKIILYLKIFFFLKNKALSGRSYRTCFSLKERLPLVRTLRLFLIIIKFLVRLFSLLLVLACGFSLWCFFRYSFRSLRPA
uniref:Uncharacterized protein n=1 Tax=Gouania willdenowi TaxID=441366 RepID=A0A8C5EFY3_GOUWI